MSKPCANMYSHGLAYHCLLGIFLLGVLLLGSLPFLPICFELPLLTSSLCPTFGLGMAFLVAIFALNIAIPLFTFALVFRLEGFIFRGFAGCAGAHSIVIFV